MAGIYIHIPFCKQRCRYCAFYSTTQHGLMDEYVATLCKELSARRYYIIGKVETIYLGGGTPSMLSHKHLQQIIECIYENYDIATETEITIEANPDDLSPEYLSGLKALLFNRISIGVQSFDDYLLQQLGRRHTATKAREAVANARAAGFENISIDLMFALPGSTAASWQHDLESAISLHPAHISAYNLTYEEDTPLYQSLQQGNLSALSEEENLQQFEQLIEQLTQAGYRHYEISNFARPGYESRHNSSYWHDIHYLGCGAAAHSYNGVSRQWNISDINKYIETTNNNDTLFEIEYLSKADRYNDAILTRLRTSDGLPLNYFYEKFGPEFIEHLNSTADKYIKNGTLQKQDGRISLTRKGIFISDAIIRDLIYIE